MTGELPLPAQLSQALVAFTIEFDNEFEHRMPHRTTRHGSTPGMDRPPYLVSMAMWVNCMRFVPEEGIPAAELARLAQDTYLRWAADAGQRWDARFGEARMCALRESAGRLTRAAGPDQSPRWPGLEPYPGGWRVAVPRPRTLPHYPVISARGGFPDGN